MVRDFLFRKDNHVLTWSLVAAGLAVGLVMAIVLFRNGFPIPDYLQTERALADITGFIAVGLTVASGVIMPFKKHLLARTRNRHGLKWVHIVVSAAGGVFVGLHIVLSQAFAFTLQYLLGFAAFGGVLAIWITGAPLTEDLRSRFPLHSFLSLIGVFLMVAHTYTAGMNIPNLTPTVELSMVVLVVIFAAARVTTSLNSSRPRADNQKVERKD